MSLTPGRPEHTRWPALLHDKLERTHPLVRKLAALDPTASVDLAADPYTLSLAEADAGEYERVQAQGKLVFHTLGGSRSAWHPDARVAVVAAMTAQLQQPAPASFLYHLGDIISDTGETDLSQRYAEEFYAVYDGYHRRIFAIPGDQDGSYREEEKDGRLKLNESSLWRFLQNFCAPTAEFSPDAAGRSGRKTMTQPAPYWLLDTPVAYLIGLHTHGTNGGHLDDPEAADYPYGPQYRWLVNRLTAIRRENLQRAQRLSPPKATLLMLHHPPYSGGANFHAEGDPRVWHAQPRYPHAIPLGMLLQEAFRDSSQRPDAVFSAHARHYERLTYCYRDGFQIPYVSIGDNDWTPAAAPGRNYMPHTHGERPAIPPFALNPMALPEGLKLGENRGMVHRYNACDPGFLRLVVDETNRQLIGEFYARPVLQVPAEPGSRLYEEAAPETLQDLPSDQFVLDLRSHKLLRGPRGMRSPSTPLRTVAYRRAFSLWNNPLFTARIRPSHRSE
ncbi:MAG TPA: hypothetical protein VKU00_18590 [Chthonomonadaceae bacterium]|nr:hypothetical protein [Chthonomonadaceae bacterium]